MDQNVMFFEWRALGICRVSACGRERESESLVKTKSACFVKQKNGHRAMCVQDESRWVTMSPGHCRCEERGREGPLSPCGRKPLKIIRIYHAYHPCKINFKARPSRHTHTGLNEFHSCALYAYVTIKVSSEYCTVWSIYSDCGLSIESIASTATKRNNHNCMWRLESESAGTHQTHK